MYEVVLQTIKYFLILNIMIIVGHNIGSKIELPSFWVQLGCSGLKCHYAEIVTTLILQYSASSHSIRCFMKKKPPVEYKCKLWKGCVMHTKQGKIRTLWCCIVLGLFWTLPTELIAPHCWLLMYISWANELNLIYIHEIVSKTYKFWNRTRSGEDYECSLPSGTLHV